MSHPTGSRLTSRREQYVWSPRVDPTTLRVGRHLLGGGQAGCLPGDRPQVVRQAEVDGGGRPGLSTEESTEIKRLRREVAELRRANEILKAAAAFFGAELDRPLTRS